MASVCQKCGDAGYRELLERCKKCEISLQHRYCLEKIPKREEKVQWVCEVCEPIYPRTVSFAKLLVDTHRNEYEWDGEQHPSSSDREAGPQECSQKVEKAQVQKIHSHANTIPQHKLQSSFTGVSQDEIEGDHPHTSKKGECRKKKKRRRLILDEEPLEVKLLPDSDNQNAMAEASVLPIEPSLASIIKDATTDMRVQQKIGDAQSNVRCNQSSISQQRRRLILDEDPLEEKLQSVSRNQNATVEASVVPIEPLPALRPSSTAEVTIGSRVAEVDATTNVRTQQEVCDIQSNILCNQSSVSQQLYFAAQPMIDHCWRGYFSFGNEEYGPLMAHISSKACEQACNVAKLLPPTLHMEKLSRLDSWPNSFKSAPPTDEQIALFFFPERWVDPVFDSLVGDAIRKDLVFKSVLDEAELLVFASTLLPKNRQRFQGKHYPWGVFRRRQGPVPTLSSKSHSLRNVHVADASNILESDKGESDGRDEDSSDVIEPSPRAPLQSCVFHRPEVNEFTEQIQKAKESLSKPAQIEAHVDSVVEMQMVKEIAASELSKVKKLQSVESLAMSARIETRVDSAVEMQMVKEIAASGLSAEKKLQSVDESDCAGEQEAGEIYDEYDDDREEGEFCAEDYERQCLQLFPLGVEDMGIVARVGSEKEVDLELGLSRRSCSKAMDLRDDISRKHPKVNVNFSSRYL